MKINYRHGSRNLVRRTQAVRNIVVHYTGAGSSKAGSANANCVYFGRAYRGASAHYFIDDSGIWEYADPGSWVAWHVGDGHGKYGITNANSVGIEVCSSGADFTKAEQGYLRDLVRSLMQRFGVDAAHVVRHYDASRKACPRPYTPNGGDPTGKKWAALHSYITGGGATPAATGGGTSAKGGTGITEDGWWGSATTKALQRHFGTTADGVVSSQSRYQKNNGVLNACTLGWEFVGNPVGSRVVIAMQRALGVGVDGIMGPGTVNALERHYGYKADGRLDGPSNTVKSMQHALNAGLF